MELGTDPDGQDVYNALVDQEGVCRNCFARTHEYSAEWPPVELSSSLRGMLQAGKFDSLPPNVMQVFPPEKQTSFPPSRNICRCGVFSRWSKTWGSDEPLSREQFKRNVKNLCERIEDAGIGYDRFWLCYTALRCKSDPEYQSRDEKAFHDALEAAVVPYVEREVDETAQKACSEV